MRVYIEKLPGVWLLYRGVRNPCGQLSIGKMHGTQDFCPICKLCEVTRDTAMVIAWYWCNQAYSKMWMVTSNCSQCPFQIRVIAANNCLIVGAKPCSGQEVRCQVDIGFLLVEVVHLDHL